VPLKTWYARLSLPWLTRDVREALAAEQIGEHRLVMQPDSCGPVELTVVLDAANEREARVRIARSLGELMTVLPFDAAGSPADGRGCVRICMDLP
jgi:hypothetical protein